MQKDRLLKLVEAYKEHFKQYNRPDYNETEVRNDFVNPFFEILGWDVQNKKNLPQHLRDVKHEASVFVEENGKQVKKKPDYEFYVGSTPYFFLETKKPNVDIMTSKEAAFQTRRYGWNGNLEISVLSNFTDLVIYDTSVRPNENDKPSVAQVAHFHFTEYVDKFYEISRMLSYETVVSGAFERTFANLSNSLKKEPFDKYFLSQIKGWRLVLSENIFENNLAINQETLNIFVQKLINRIVFLRICEDRELEKYESLKNIGTYVELKKVFAEADKKYDSGLFELIDGEQFEISDSLLVNIFKELYYPNSCYEFSIVNPFIIGQIYELFLEEEIVIKGKIIIAERKSEIVDSQGVVNTPKNVADIIVKTTLNPLFTDEKFMEWDSYRIADICCGSGNFLLSAYEFIINRYVEYYIQNDLETAIQRGILIHDTANNFKLSYEQKRKILQKNIWGVDIDILAVEVAKFSLLIKLVEDSSLYEMECFVKNNGCRILPSLDNNIKNGNSLVDEKYMQYNHNLLDNPKLIEKIKIFNWETEFAGKKFDAIIGNPPYIRVQNMVHFSESEYEYYKSEFSEYETARTDLLDKYFLFLEKGLTLLKPNGKMGYIIPHKFMLISSGSSLRKILSEMKCVKQIIHFGTEQVFKGRSTYTCLLFVEKKERKSFEVGFVKDINRFYATGVVDMQEYPIEYLGVAPWTFLSNEIVQTLEKKKEHCQPLEFLVDIFVGLQTSADPIYIIEPKSETEGIVKFVDCRGKEWQIESAITKPCIYDVQLEKYARIKENRRIIFPYYQKGKKQVLYSIDEIKQLFPKTLKYLDSFKEELCKRSINKMSETDWYQFGRSQSLKRFVKGEHLVWPVLATQGNYVYDTKTICFTGGGNGPFYGLEKKDSTRESLFYIQAVLNYWMIEMVVKSKASKFRGDYYSHGKQFVAQLPIYRINFNDSNEVKFHDEIVDNVKKLMKLKNKRDEQQTKLQKETYMRLIQIEDKKLDELISKLYGAENCRREDLDEA